MHMAKQVIYVLDQCQKDPTKDQCYHPFLFQITPEENTMNNKFKPIIVFKTFTVLFYVRGLSEQPYGCQQHTLLFTTWGPQ